MKYTDLQISAIKIFGRKDLTFGCVLELKEKEDGDVNYFYVCKSDFDGDTVFAKTKEKGYEDCTLEFDRSEYEILGHEPHLFPDVARVVKDIGGHLSVSSEGIINIYTKEKHITIEHNQTLPLLEQSESTLQQLISLFE